MNMETSPLQHKTSKPIVVHILEHNDSAQKHHTLIFDGNNSVGEKENEYHVRSVIHSDDSIRAMKKKILMELFFGKWASKIKTKPAYEEIYLYGFVQERAAFVRMFEELMKTLGQNHLSKEQAKTLFQTLGLKVELKLETYSYEDLQTLVENQKQILSVKIPIGMVFIGNRDFTFEVDPFRALSGVFSGPENLFLAENKLFLNYGEIIGNEIYVCCAEKIASSLEFSNSDKEKQEYLVRYYYPLLYKAGVRNKDDWQNMRGKMVETTRDMLDDKLGNLYKSVELFYKVDSIAEPVEYAKRGICKALIQIKNEKSANVSLEMIFKSLHSSVDIPFIKYNPGSRRENLYRLYYEKIARNGKKIPYLTKTAIWRISKETGKKQEISLFVESGGADSSPKLKYYLHIQANGNVLVEVDIGSKTMSEEELETALLASVNPVLDRINLQIMQTSVVLPKFISLRDVATQIMNMQYCLKTAIRRHVSLDKLPCIYSLFTFSRETDKNKREVRSIRYRRVENFQETHAETAYILEMLQQTGYDETFFVEIVEGLVEKFQMKEEEAKMLLATYYTKYLQVGGEVMENPGFPVTMETVAEDSSLEIRVDGITSVQYLESIFVYFNAIICLTQHTKKYGAILDKMGALCGTGVRKTAVGNADVVIADNIVATNEEMAAEILAQNVAASDMGFVRDKKEADELFRQFGIFDEDDKEEADKMPVGEEVHVETEVEELFEDDLVDVSVEELMKELKENAKESYPTQGPIFYEDEEEEGDQEEEETKEESIFDSMLSVFKKSPETTEKIPDESVTQVKQEATTKTGPIFYDDEEEEEEEEEAENSGPKKQGGKSPDDDTPEDDDKYRIKPDGMPLVPNPFLKRLQKADPALFLAKPSGKFGSYSTSCQPVSRHPVVLSKEEFDKVDPNSYDQHVKYGTDSTHQNYYICPKYWCFLTDKSLKIGDKLPPGRPISEEDVLAGKCGRIIDKKDKKVPPGAYALKMSEAQQYPGFMTDSHPDGHCLPCCAKQWDSKKQIATREKCVSKLPEKEILREKKIGKKTQQYVISSDTYPVATSRWGFLPIPVQFFLRIDYEPAIDKNIPGIILPDKPTLLRWGVQHERNQSILGLFADIYAYKAKIATPSVAGFKQILVEKITIDIFVKVHNGTLPSIFKPTAIPENIVGKYRQQIRASGFAGRLNPKKPGEQILLENTVAAYDNFLNYIRDDTVKIDHTYMWDLICEPLIIPNTKGMNLVIMEMNDNDLTGRIELICPTSSHSRNQFEENRENILVLKHEEFYEPIYQCVFLTGDMPFASVKTFTTENINPVLIDVLRNIEASTKKYCPALPSLPKVYKYRQPIMLKKLVKLLETHKYGIKSQIVNYSGKIIGLAVEPPVIDEKPATTLYIPCATTSMVTDYAVKYMDNMGLLGDYDTVKKELMALHKITGGEVPCHPVFKVLENELIIGFITETNQFIPLVPTENIHIDNLKIHPSVSHIRADIALQTSNKGDTEREVLYKKIKLETQFYNTFRGVIRKQLSEFSKRQWKKDITDIIADRVLFEKQKREKVEEKLREMVGDTIIFVDIDDRVLMSLDEVNECYAETANDTYCLVKENGVAQLSIPAKHLMAEEYSNEKIYYGRLADDLVRNERVRLFMLNTRNYTNVGNVEYNIKGDEFIIAQSVLTTDYFQNMETFETNKYTANSVFDSAQPSISALYPNGPIPYSEQYKEKELVVVQKEMDCVVEEKEIIGNNRNFWKRNFPANAREIVYRESETCSWMIVVEILKHKYGEIFSLEKARNMLKEAYADLFSHDENYKAKVANSLKQQGKSKLMESVVKKKVELADLVVADEYYISDMDIWVLCWKYNIPVVLFNTNGLKGFSQKGLQWLKMGGEINSVYLFIRSNIGSFANKIYSYHVIRPAYRLSDLAELRSMVLEGAAKDSEYRVNIEELPEFLDKVTLIQAVRK